MAEQRPLAEDLGESIVAAIQHASGEVAEGVAASPLMVALGGIPLLGGAITWAISSHAGQSQEQRVRLLIKALKKRIERVEGLLVECDPDDRCFVDLVVECLAGVARERSGAKIELFANVLLNGARTESPGSEPIHQCIATLQALSEDAIVLFGEIVEEYDSHERGLRLADHEIQARLDNGKLGTYSVPIQRLQRELANQAVTDALGLRPSEFGRLFIRVALDLIEVEGQAHPEVDSGVTVALDVARPRPHPKHPHPPASRSPRSRGPDAQQIRVVRHRQQLRRPAPSRRRGAGGVTSRRGWGGRPRATWILPSPGSRGPCRSPGPRARGARLTVV